MGVPYFEWKIWFLSAINPCESRPCLNGGKCVNRLENDEYWCDCDFAHEYRGSNCQGARSFGKVLQEGSLELEQRQNEPMSSRASFSGKHKNQHKTGRQEIVIPRVFLSLRSSHEVWREVGSHSRSEAIWQTRTHGRVRLSTISGNPGKRTRTMQLRSRSELCRFQSHVVKTGTSAQQHLQ